MRQTMSHRVTSRIVTTKRASLTVTKGGTGMRKSDWLPKGKKPCTACKGTGRSGRTNKKGETIVCPKCRGFGY